MVQTIGCAAPSHMRDQLCPCALRVSTLLINACLKHHGRGRAPQRALGAKPPLPPTAMEGKRS